MLTKSDLNQIRQIIREENEAEGENIRQELGSQILETKMKLSNDIDTVRNQVKNVDIKVARVKKSTDKMDKFLDKEQMKTTKRVKTIEEHLGLHSTQ